MPDVQRFAQIRRTHSPTGQSPVARTRGRIRVSGAIPPWVHGADSIEESFHHQTRYLPRLTRDGLSNPEIATRLFISPRTVQHHLSKVSAKLGISSRGELHRVLPGDPDHGAALS